MSIKQATNTYQVASTIIYTSLLAAYISSEAYIKVAIPSSIMSQVVIDKYRINFAALVISPLVSAFKNPLVQVIPLYQVSNTIKRFLIKDYSSFMEVAYNELVHYACSNLTQLNQK